MTSDATEPAPAGDDTGSGDDTGPDDDTGPGPGTTPGSLLARAGGLTGGIVIVGTPIGNLGDLSPRAVDTLAGADVICCEDTRHTRKLLTHAGVHPRALVALHEHNETVMAPRLIAQAGAGAVVAVVTDAGMPGISDPGERLVRAALDAGVTVAVVPGPTAVTSALVISGLPSGRWCFEGFLPRKGPERAARLAALAAEDRTVALYESPHRLVRTLEDLARACGPSRPVVVARELTKLHEELWRGSLAGAVAWAGGRGARGEYVIMVGPLPPSPPVVPGDDEVTAALAAHLAAGRDRKTAVAAVTAELGVSRRVVYAAALRLPR